MWNVPAGIDRLQHYMVKNGFATDVCLSNLSSGKHYWLIEDGKRVEHPRLNTHKVDAEQYDLVGLSLMAPELFMNLTDFSEYIKQYDENIVITGGPGVWDYSEEILDFPEVDFTVNKWGELALLSLSNKLKGKKHLFPLTEKTFSEALSSVPPGVVGKYKGDSRPWTTQDLNYHMKMMIHLKEGVVPHIIFSSFDQPEDIPKEAFNYIDSKRKILILDESLGCINKCNFCWWSNSTKYYARPIEDLIRDVITARPREIVIDSASFLHKHNLERVNEFADRLLELKAERKIPNFTMNCQARADGFTDGIVKKLSKLNTSIYLGEEFGSQRLLDITRKNTIVEQNMAAAELCAKYKVPLHGFFMLTTQEASAQDVKNTLALTLYNHKVYPNFVASVNTFTLVRKGTPFYDKNQREIDLLQANWRTERNYGKNEMRKLKEKEIAYLEGRIIPRDKEAFRLAWNLDVEKICVKVLRPSSLKSVVRKANWLGNGGLEDIIALFNKKPEQIKDYIFEHQ